MNEMYIISFNSTHNAIKMEKLLVQNNIKVTTLPTPREISASCGISIRFLLQDIEEVRKIMNENEVDNKGIFRVFKDEQGKRNIESM